MSNPLINVAVVLEQFVCGECSGTYAITERYARQKRDKSGYWTCPYCKCDWGYAKGELQRALEALEAEKERHKASLSRLNEATLESDKLKRQRARVQRGVCPCCNRSFMDLKRHMATKHPEKKSAAD